MERKNKEKMKRNENGILIPFLMFFSGLAIVIVTWEGLEFLMKDYI